MDVVLQGSPDSAKSGSSMDVAQSMRGGSSMNIAQSVRSVSFMDVAESVRTLPLADTDSSAASDSADVESEPYKKIGPG